MRAVIVHAPGRANLAELRQTLLGAGVDCGPEDCVPWNDLHVRLAQNGEVNLLVLKTGEGAPSNWDAMLSEARALTPAPVVAIGPAGTDDEHRAQRAGIAAYVNEANLPQDLDRALEQFTATPAGATQRGRVWSVFAPTPGSGGTTVAASLAGALARRHPEQVTLLELSRQFGELALLLGVTPEYPMEELCRRWQRLDMISLRHSVVPHAGGVNLIVHSRDAIPENLIHWEAVRRLAVLARIAFPNAVLAVDSRLGREKLEAFRLSDKVVLVVRPDVPSVKRAEWELHAAEEAGLPRERFYLTVNCWGQRGQLQAGEIERTLGLKIRRRIPHDPGRVNNAANHGMLLQQFSRASSIARAFRHLGDDLLQETPSEH